MEAGAVKEEFITIVPVGENKPAVQDPSFVTVLTVGAASGAAEVIVQRPRGARLGLGLKFEGGSAAAERVRRLLVQSCADESPAAKASAPWGKLIPGDEILAIDGVSVSELTRIDCVRRLKDSDEKLKLLVRHFEFEDKMDNLSKTQESKGATTIQNEITRPTTLPPPVPPRKLGKKNSFKDKSTLQTVGEQNTLTNVDKKKNENFGINNQNCATSTATKLSRKSSFDSHLFRQNKESIACLKKGSPEEVRRLVRRLSDGKAFPPEAEVYIDLLSNEWERCLAMADAESDDTGSSISTVIDRLGSMANSVENSIPSTPIMQPKSIDIQKVLNSIENIDNNILKDLANKKIKDQKIENDDVCKRSEKIVAPIEAKSKNAISTNSTATKEIIVTPNKFPQSDKNNNHAADENLAPKPNLNDVVKQEVILEKPKPMPRNTKVERSASDRKRRPIPIPEPISTSPVDQLLTPTKKNCIETWLQRSEAEMNSKDVAKNVENSVPEILPRLIDFVPKSQFVDSSTDTPPCIRPTTAPPPPPVENREDGSGASLDTIGELDESCDVTDNSKPRLENEPSKRKSSFDKSFWNDRITRSDTEDKSLSNDEAPVPTCPRQPPDGVETPSDAIEKTPDLPSRLPPRLPTGWLGARPRFSYNLRSQDARSEASVKDKIAMFSSDLNVSSDRLDKCGTLPVRSHSTLRKSVTPYAKNYSEISSLDRRLTKSQDNLDENPCLYKRQPERPEVLGGVESTKIESYSSKINSYKPDLHKPLFYGSTTTLASDTGFNRTVCHSRSISEDSTNSTGSHKSNLEYLIEQRKKSMSKLRGLAIPEMQAPIVDLPEIKVKDNFSKSFLQKYPKPEIKKESSVKVSKPLTNFNDNKWNTNFLPNNIPKYSPAFKRKSLQVYTPSCLSKESTPERKFAEKIETMNKTHSVLQKPLRTSSDLARTSLFNSSTQYKQYNNNNIGHYRDLKHMEIKMCTAVEVVDSDNDSAMSSTQSSYRSSASSPMQNLDNVESDCSRMSPKVLHYTSYLHNKSEFNKTKPSNDKITNEFVKRNVCRSVSSDTNVSLSSSAGSAATSGSQASCSSLESSVADSDKRRVSKTYDVDTINRRNILASAKCRSGRDITLKSPVIETKYSHESLDRSPSPVHKASERLSTLPSTVSVVTNKGDNRRRNKVIVESDSDSDSELAIRQRKPEFKNIRLKRNLSTNSKNKQNPIISDPVKKEDAPQVIKDKTIFNNMNKAGKDDFDNGNCKRSNTVNIKQNLTNNSISKKWRHEENNNIDIKNDDLDEVLKLKSKTNIITTNKSNLIESKEKAKVNSFSTSNVKSQLYHLKRGNGSGVGLILAGGIDCEAKHVTVHRVLSDSIAAKAGIEKGSKVRSINGCSTSGLTHAQSVSILKEQRPEVVIEIENEVKGSTECGSENAESKIRLDSNKVCSKNANAGSIVKVVLEKAGGGAGLGFGLDGGRDSPNGDLALTIKKLFAGGAAAQSGRVKVGAELLSAGGQSFEGFTRTQAWAALKALPAGQVVLVLKNPANEGS